MEILHGILQVYIFISCAFTTFFLFGLIGQLRKAFSSKETDEMLEQVKAKLKVVYLERVGDTHYLYEKVTNNFIAQGNSEDEMWANAKLTFPKQDFIIEGEDGKAILVSVKDKQ